MKSLKFKKGRVTAWLSVVLATWLVTFVILGSTHIGLDTQTEADTGSTGSLLGRYLSFPLLKVIVNFSDGGQHHNPALEIGSVQQAGALGVAILGLESEMDSVGKKLFITERNRLNNEMRHEMDAESLKQRNTRTGEVRRLSRRRQLEPEEVEEFRHRRDSELKRLAQQIATERCATASQCENSTVSKILRAISGGAGEQPFATRPFLRFASDADGRRIFGANLKNVSLLGPWLPDNTSEYRYGSCAVVGNSGALKSSNMGSAIDSHEAVIRVNQAPTEGYERDVGSRATIRVLNSAWGQSYLSHPQADRLITGVQAGELLVPTRIGAINFVRLCEKLRHARGGPAPLLLSNTVVADARLALDVFRLQSQRRSLLHSLATSKSPNGGSVYKGGQAPSTGLLAVVLGLRLCGAVSVYGFSHEISRDASSSSWPYHYFSNYVDSTELRAHPHHSFKLEGDLLSLLHGQGAIRSCEDPRCSGGQTPRGKDHEQKPQDARSGASGRSLPRSGQSATVHRLVAAAKARVAETQIHSHAHANGALHLPQHGKGYAPPPSPGGSSSTDRPRQSQPAPGRAALHRPRKDAKELDSTSAKKVAFLKASSAPTQPKQLGSPGGDAPSGEPLTWEMLSSADQEAVARVRDANKGLDNLLSAAVEDAVELKQVEKGFKRMHSHGAKVVTLKSGAKLSVSGKASGSELQGPEIDNEPPKIVDPMMLVEGADGSERRSARRSSRRRQSSPSPSAGNASEVPTGTGANQHSAALGAQSAGGSLAGGVSAGAPSGVAEELPSGAKNAVGRAEPMPFPVGRPPAAPIAQERDRVLAEESGFSESGMDTGNAAPDRGLEGESPEVDVGVDTLAGPGLATGEPLSFGGGLVGDNRGEGAVIMLPSEDRLEETLSPAGAEEGEEGEPLAGSDLVEADADGNEPASTSTGTDSTGQAASVGSGAARPEPGTPGEALNDGDLASHAEHKYASAEQRKSRVAVRKFKSDQRAAAKLARMPLDDIADPELRRREEAWRRMDQELPAKQIDTKCLARGSSDGCFREWLKGSTGQRADSGVPMHGGDLGHLLRLEEARKKGQRLESMWHKQQHP